MPFSPYLLGLPLAAVVFIAGIQLIWLWSVVTVARQKTADPFDRIVWLIIVLSLNIVGTILYALFSPYNVIDPGRFRPMRKAYPQQARPQGRTQASTGAKQEHHHTDYTAENGKAGIDGSNHGQAGGGQPDTGSEQ